MINKFLYIYNNLVKLSTNKKLYFGLDKQDTFNDRLVFFLIHFTFFLKAFKHKENKKILQTIYDFNFRQLELSIREIGYGDQSINKKMKDYVNLHYSIISEIERWDFMKKDEKKKILFLFVDKSLKIDYLVDYFDNFYEKLLKITLNYYLKSVSNH